MISGQSFHVIYMISLYFVVFVAPEEREKETERAKGKTGMFLSRESNLLFTGGGKKRKTAFLSIAAVMLADA